MTEHQKQKAKELLSRLQEGKNIAVPSIYIDPLAFSDHAHLYFENAAALCRAPTNNNDFSIFSVLYNIRHGMELWLKCLLRNQLMDRFLTQTFQIPSATLEKISEKLGLQKSHRIQFQQTLCCLRNVYVEGIKFPDADPWAVNVGPSQANQGLEYLSEHPSLDRHRFALICRVQIGSHNLFKLWKEADHLIRSFHPNEMSLTPYYDGPAPGQTSDEVAEICHLLHSLDPGGDAFRYPATSKGHWHTHLPHFDLARLGTLAEGMANTVQSFEIIRDEAYNSATVSRPYPF